MHGKRQSSTFGGLFYFMSLWRNAETCWIVDLVAVECAGSSPVIPTTRV